jgi:hypothetical protein
MSYTSAEARELILDDLGSAVDRIAVALAALGDAYELLDDQTADALEETLFRPVQAAYGRGQRTHTEFAKRYGLRERTFEQPSSGAEVHDPRILLDRVSDAAEQAEQEIADLQDGMLPVEVGDKELRAGLSEVRELLSRVPARAAELVRTVGR